MDQGQAKGLGEVTGPGEDEKAYERGERMTGRPAFLGGVTSLLLPVGLVNGGGSGQDG